MAVALSSLRVSSDFDASAYVGGAQQKVAADGQMIASDRARNAALARVAAGISKAIPSMNAVITAIGPASSFARCSTSWPTAYLPHSTSDGGQPGRVGVPVKPQPGSSRLVPGAAFL